MEIYPLTIIKDRFNGTYSGGKFVAWNCQPCNVPSDTYTREAFECWMDIHNFEDDTENPYPAYGVGDTTEGAIKNLENKLEPKEQSKIKVPCDSCPAWRDDWNRCGDYSRSSDCIAWSNWYSTTFNK